MTYDLDKCVENSMNTIKVYYSFGERIVIRRFARDSFTKARSDYLVEGEEGKK